MDDLDTRISGFLDTANTASIDLGSFAEQASEMGLATATALAIAQANPDKAADLVSLLADLLAEVNAASDGMVVSDGYIAVQLLARLGRTASTAIPALEHCMGLDGGEYDLVRWLRLMAAEAISKITGSPEPALSVATELLGDPEWWLVGHAAEALANIGPAAKPAIAHLEQLLNHDHESTQRHVKAAIDKIEVS